MTKEFISIKGAKENNLKNIDLKIPRDKMIVFTGLSGSGKTSLAFDTIYAEGRRRYVESLSSYARMFLGQMNKPDVDNISGLSPAISIDQKTTSKNPRSTVGTVVSIVMICYLIGVACKTFPAINDEHIPVIVGAAGGVRSGADDSDAPNPGGGSGAVRSPVLHCAVGLYDGLRHPRRRPGDCQNR